MVLDTKHKLVLVRRDGVEHLIVVGPAATTVIETNVKSAQAVAAEDAETAL